MSFKLAGGTVAGRDHLLDGKNNQDGYCFTTSPTGDLIVAIACDGCGSCKYSEVGANLGARLVAKTIVRVFKSPPPKAAEHLSQVKFKVCCDMKLFAEKMAGEDPDVEVNIDSIINNYFLFTIVGALITPTEAAFFSIGDGTLVVNEEQIPIGPFPNNEPPYIGYNLVETGIDRSLLEFKLHRVLPTEELQSFLIGSDGAAKWDEPPKEGVAGQINPTNKRDKVGALSQFWQEDRYFRNAFNVSRALAQLNCITVPKRREEGLLIDDTTIITGRRV